VQRRKIPGKHAFFARHRYRVDVIGHQTIRPQLDAELFLQFQGEPQVALVVVIVEERRLPANTSLGDMMRISSNY
jgi:hypothetical protein